jgi:hypothetical protein
MANQRRPGLFSGVSLWTLYRAWHAPDDELSAAEAASTIFRFFRSKHIADLRLIVLLALILSLFVSTVLTVLVIFFPDYFKDGEIVEFLIKYLGSALGLGGLVIGWAYRSASARLGVIDLFGAEISTLCRVGTIVDIGAVYITLYSNPPPLPKPDEKSSSPENFVSQEDYFPIFDKNANGLQILEASIVTYISEFYTYMKATRDTQRHLAMARRLTTEGCGLAGQKADVPPTAWCAAVANVIYMLFLGYESARKATDELIEFEPNAAECKMVILITELSCYAFLCKFFKNDKLRHDRLILRQKDYLLLVPDVYCRVTSHNEKDEDWQRALRTAPALEDKYFAAFGEHISCSEMKNAKDGQCPVDPGLV